MAGGVSIASLEAAIEYDMDIHDGQAPQPA